MGLLCAEQNVGHLKKRTFKNSGTPARSTRRRKSQKMHFQEFWDSCAQNNTSEISTNALSDPARSPRYQKRCQSAPRGDQKRPRTSKVSPKLRQGCPKNLPRAPNSPQELLKGPPEAPKRAPKWCLEPLQNRHRKTKSQKRTGLEREHDLGRGNCNILTRKRQSRILIF